VGLHGRGVDGGGLVPKRAPLPALYWGMDKVGGPSPDRLQQGNLSLVCLHHGKLIRATLIRLDCLVLHAKLSSHLWTHMSGRAGLLTGRWVF
jgi:hypothetical protein